MKKTITTILIAVTSILYLFSGCSFADKIPTGVYLCETPYIRLEYLSEEIEGDKIEINGTIYQAENLTGPDDKIRFVEPDDYNNLEEEEHMHCFLLYYLNGKVYHIEHPNFEKIGIYEYNNEKEAVSSIVNYYINLRGGKESPTKEFFEVRPGLSFKEFNNYINHLGNDIIK